MRILLLTSDLPSPADRPGGGQLSFRWVKELSDRLQFSLLSLVRPEESSRISSLEEIFAEVRTVAATGGPILRPARASQRSSRPRSVTAASSRRLQAALEEMLVAGDYDCVQLENFPVGQYAPSIPKGISRVQVFRDLPGEVLRRQVWLARGRKKYYYFRQWKLSHYWEKWYAIWSGNVFVMSLQDRRTVESWDIGVRTFIMPPLFDPGLSARPAGEREEGRILFFGSFSRPGVVDAAVRLKTDILPRVRREFPAAKCLVAGEDPPERIRRLAAGDFAVTGDMNRIDSYISSAALLAMPLRVAGGISLEIIEALAAGCPAVATRLSAAGTGARDGREILVADRPDDFAAAIVRLLKSPGERDRLGRAGRVRVKEKFDRSRSREKVLEAYRKIAGK